MQDKLTQLYAQEMSRADFLRYSGVVLMGILGITTVLRLVLHTDITKLNAPVAQGYGYGTSTYGGAPLGRG